MYIQKEILMDSPNQYEIVRCILQDGFTYLDGAELCKRIANTAKDNKSNMAFVYEEASKILRNYHKEEFDKRVRYLNEIAKLPGYHPVEGDLGSVPI